MLISKTQFEVSLYFNILFITPSQIVSRTLFFLQLAKVLQIDLGLVKVALSLFCRLGFAQRKTYGDSYAPDDPSWNLGIETPVKGTLWVSIIICFYY